MKKSKNLFTRSVLSLFVLSLVPTMGTQTASAASLTNATVVLDNVFQTQLAVDTETTDTSITVLSDDGIADTDVIFISDGVSSETETVSGAPAANVVTLGAAIGTAFDADVAQGVDVTVLTGIDMEFDFDTAATAGIEAIRVTFDANAIADGASFNGATSTFDAGVATGGADDADQADFFELNADGSSIAGGTSVGFTLAGVRIPNGSTTNSYAIDIQTCTDDGCTNPVDTVTVFFGVDTGVVVQGEVDSLLTFTIEDDGTQNNADDTGAGSGSIAFGTLGTDTSNDIVTGRGVDGNLITVTTNATNGYSITIEDTVNGLVNPNFAGGGRPSGDTDDGIDDTAGGAFETTGEAYGYKFDVGSSTLDGDCDDNDYVALSNTATAMAGTSSAPITNEQTVVTFCAQVVGTTPAGIYSDQITYIITPNF